MGRVSSSTYLFISTNVLAPSIHSTSTSHSGIRNVNFAVGGRYSHNNFFSSSPKDKDTATAVRVSSARGTEKFLSNVPRILIQITYNFYRPSSDDSIAAPITLSLYLSELLIVPSRIADNDNISCSLSMLQIGTVSPAGFLGTPYVSRNGLRNSIDSFLRGTHEGYSVPPK